MATYSTVDYRPGEMHRDLELIIPESYLSEYEDWFKSLGDMVLALPSPHGDESSDLGGAGVGQQPPTSENQ